jgi:tetratricopeptide (TPR) repeat protein
MRGQMIATAALIVGIGVLTRAQTNPYPQISDVSLTAVQRWAAAVETHTPGRADGSVAGVAALSYAEREELNNGVGLFLTAVMGWKARTDGNRAAETILALGQQYDRNFVKRAAVLHADAAAYGNLVPAARKDAAKEPSRRKEELQMGSGAAPQQLPYNKPIPPLLMADRVLLNKDGEVIGEVVSTWNWPFARSLLDLLSAESRTQLFSDGKPQAATDPFVSAWYHATTAYMFASGLYGDATTHLHHASMVLPDDALALFDRACYAEILGLPMHQALVPDEDVGQRARSNRAAPTWTTPSSAPALRIPSEEQTNADAERLFRRALAVDPGLIEARARLGRLLELRGNHRAAAAELSTALAANPTGVVAFYVRMFAARSAQSLGQMSEAAHHYQAAMALFPDAQSALLGSSHLGLLAADVPGTLAPVGRLGGRAAAFTADPWWEYHLATGRDADGLLRALWARVPGPAPVRAPK